MLLVPLAQRGVGEADERAVRVEAAHIRHELVEALDGHRLVDERGQKRSLVCDIAQQRQPAHHIMRARAQLALVVVVQELRLVRRHVHVNRAFANTRLTGQAQVEGSLHFLGIEAVLDGLATKHLTKHARTSTCRVHLIAGYLDSVKGQHCQRLDLRHRHQLNLQFRDDARGSLRARQRLGGVEAMLIQQVVQPVTGNVAWKAAELGVDKRGVCFCKFSAAVPKATECEPHALLATMPPTVQRECVDGSGP